MFGLGILKTFEHRCAGLWVLRTHYVGRSFCGN